MKCPSCSATINYDDRFASTLICEYCQTAMTFDSGVFEIQGEMSLLALPIGPIAVGSYGSLYGKGFQVLGRIRYGYAAGAWDEWYLVFDDQTTAWFSEDEKRFTLEHPVTVTADAADIKSLEPGQKLSLNSKEFIVRELGVAICEGGEGQLPFPLILDQEYFYVDLQAADGGRATVEVEPDGSIKFFDGDPVALSALVIDNPVDSAVDSYEDGAHDSLRQRVSMTGSRVNTIQCLGCGATQHDIDWSSDDIKCSHCALPMVMPAKTGSCSACGNSVQAMSSEAVSVVCAYCNTVVVLSDNPQTSTVQTVASAKKKHKNPSIFPLGMWATFDNMKFQLVGNITYTEENEGVYEYLFYAKAYGYRWLSCYNGHFSLEEKIEGGLKTSYSACSALPCKAEVKEFGKKWKMFERGNLEVFSVYGEMPWVAQKGDRSRYVEFIRPPFSLTIERSKNEMEFSVGKYISRSELQEAIGPVKVKWPWQSGVASNQVNTKKPEQCLLAFIAALFAVLAGFFAYGNLNSGTLVSNMTVSASQYKEEHLTKSFELSGENFNKIEMRAAVDNSWIWVDFALVNEKEQSILDGSANLSYYHGYEGGESWSEGSREDVFIFKDVPAGKYKLLLLGKAGKGNSSKITTGRGEPINIKVFDKVRLARYYLALSIVSLVFTILSVGLAISFEAKRWQHLREG